MPFPLTDLHPSPLSAIVKVHMGKSTSVEDRITIQAGAIPFRPLPKGGVEVMLITNTVGKWIVPKGGVDEGHTPRQGAVIECFEEAGVRGTLLPGEVGHYDYEKNGEACRVILYALRVTEVLTDWPEARRRKRIWLPLAEAVKRVAFPNLAQVLRKLAETA
ncbi:NUDIX hydrolase [soil metagenome]